MFATALLLQEDRLTIGEIIGNIPHDGPAFLVYLLVAAFVFLIWWGNRKSGENAPGDSAPQASQPPSRPAQGSGQARPGQRSERGSHRHTGR